MRSTMQDSPLTIGSIRQHGTTVHRDSEVVTATPDGSVDVVRRARRAGRPPGERAALPRASPATSGWRRSSGTTPSTSRRTSPSRPWAPCSTRSTSGCSPSSSSTSPTTPRTRSSSSTTRWSAAGQAARQLETVKHVLVVRTRRGVGRPGLAARAGKEVTLYDDLLAEQSEEFDWPEVDERDAAAMCYTSGTTGNPKGVVYSHRSAWLHSQAVCTAAVAGSTSTTGSCRSCRCSTPTPGVWPTPR